MVSVKHVCTAIFSSVAILAFVALASPAFAQGPSADTKAYTDHRRLGTANSFNGTPLTNAASVKRMAEKKGMADDIRKLLSDAGIPETSAAVLATMSGATSSFKGGRCSDMTPQDGVLMECQFQKGETLEWMAHRPKARKGDRTPARLIDVRWVGPAFPAFLFRVTTNDKVYTFILPKQCGNLALMSDAARPSMAAAQPAATPTPPTVAPPVPATPIATPTPVATPAPRPTPTPAVAAPPVPTPVPTPAAQPAPALTAQPAQPTTKAGGTVGGKAAGKLGFFVDALPGKDRRVRPVDDRTTTDGSIPFANAGTVNGDLSFAQCSPMLFLKFGVAKRWDNNWELAGAVGIGLSFVTDDKKVREHELMADVEVNKYLGKHDVLLGTGLSFWDITHSDTFTPAWMVHVGVPLGSQRVYLMGEGRLFLKQLDDISNNYQVSAGVRIRF